MPKPQPQQASSSRAVGPAAPTALTSLGAPSPTRRQRWRSWAGWLLLAGLLILADQAAKTWVLHSFVYGERLPVLPIFDLTLLFNTGAAFSFLADSGGGQRWLFTGIALLVSGLILRWLHTHTDRRLFCLALSCILGGALGNAVDRLLHGHVVDFLLFYWRDWYFPAFNVADIAITCGAGLLILDEILTSRRARQS